MTPLLACFPVCMTLVALGILMLLVIATGAVGPGAEPEAIANQRPPEPEYEKSGPPPWWVVMLIFAAVAAVALLMNWAAADS